MKERILSDLQEPTIIYGKSSILLTQKIEEMECLFRNTFPEIGTVRFEATELFTHATEGESYVLKKLAETEQKRVVMVNGLEKVLPSECAQKIFLELYASWHVTGKIIYITTAVPLEGGQGWNERLLKRLEWGRIIRIKS